MFTFLGILGFLITVLIAIPASLIAFASIIESPIKTIIKLWVDLIQTYRTLWENISK
jgi:ABC-type phosphate/phosphonate transport system permease subunit